MAGVSKVTPGLMFGKIIQQVNVSREILSKHCGRVYVPGGFPYEAFNGKGNVHFQAFVRPWSILRMVESARCTMLQVSKDQNRSVKQDVSFMDAVRLYKDHLFFIASTSTNISPKFYETSLMKGPLKMEMMIDYIGSKTFKLKILMYLPGCSEPICENDTQSVIVSNQTRLPANPPEWWREKYTLGSNNGKPLKLDRLKVPENVEMMHYQFQVPANDIDSNIHVNWSSFVKYAHNALVHTEFQKYGMQKANLAVREVQHFSVAFIKEAKLGDNINVQYWINLENPHIYHFQVLREAELIAECTLEFFS